MNSTHRSTGTNSLPLRSQRRLRFLGRLRVRLPRRRHAFWPAPRPLGKAGGYLNNLGWRRHRAPSSIPPRSKSGSSRCRDSDPGGLLLSRCARCVSRNRRIVNIDASKMLSCPSSHLSTVEMETPSSRDNRAFFHFECSAKVRSLDKTSAFSCSLRSFRDASMGVGIIVVS